jgi:hypothetical protein
MRNVKNATAEEAICMTRIMQSRARFAAPIHKDGGNWKNTTVTITASMRVRTAVEPWLRKTLRRRQIFFLSLISVNLYSIVIFIKKWHSCVIIYT